VKIRPLEQEVELLHGAKFQCFGVNVVWKYQTNENLPSNAHPEENGALVIHSANFNNEGYYECKGEYHWRKGAVFYSYGYLSVFGNNYSNNCVQYGLWICVSVV